MIDLSIVIPCHKADRTLPSQLQALAEQQWDGVWEVVLADNGSRHGYADILAEFKSSIPLLRCVDASSQRGAAYARNVGVRSCCSRSVTFVDADDTVAENYVPVMGKALQEHDFVACRFDTQKLNETWQAESWENSQDKGLIEFYPKFLPFAGGGSLGIKRDIHLGVGGFDESFSSRMSMEEADYCWRVQLAGTPLEFIPDTSIAYRYPKTFRKTFRQMRKLGEASVLLYFSYLDKGMPRANPHPKIELSLILKILRNLPERKGKAERARRVRSLGWHVGRLIGCWRHGKSDSYSVFVSSLFRRESK